MLSHRLSIIVLVPRHYPSYIYAALIYEHWRITGAEAVSNDRQPSPSATAMKAIYNQVQDSVMNEEVGKRKREVFLPLIGNDHLLSEIRLIRNETLKCIVALFSIYK